MRVLRRGLVMVMEQEAEMALTQDTAHVVHSEYAEDLTHVVVEKGDLQTPHVTIDPDAGTVLPT